MISNEQEFTTTQQRIDRFQRQLLTLRRTARPQEFDAVASGYRLEIERMQAEVMEYLLCADPAPEMLKTDALTS